MGGFGSENVVVEASKEQGDLAGCFRAGCENDPLGAGRDVTVERLLRPVLAGRLQHYVDAEVRPRDVAGFPGVEKCDLFVVISKRPVAIGHGHREAAVDRVILEQVGEGFGIGDVGDGHDVEVISIMDKPKEVPPDPSETHQPNTGCGHQQFLSKATKIVRTPCPSESRPGTLGSGRGRSGCCFCAGRGMSGQSGQRTGGCGVFPGWPIRRSLGCRLLGACWNVGDCAGNGPGDIRRIGGRDADSDHRTGRWLQGVALVFVRGVSQEGRPACQGRESRSFRGASRENRRPPVDPHRRQVRRSCQADGLSQHRHQSGITSGDATRALFSPS